jgi:hypothetical protein
VNLIIECTYCGHKWEKAVYNKQSIEDEKCVRCGDSNLKVRDASVSKVDAYKGCPAFPQKKITLNDWNMVGADFAFGEGNAFIGMDHAMDAIRTQIVKRLAMPPGDML